MQPSSSINVLGFKTRLLFLLFPSVTTWIKHVKKAHTLVKRQNRHLLIQEECLIKYYHCKTKKILTSGVVTDCFSVGRSGLSIVTKVGLDGVSVMVGKWSVYWTASFFLMNWININSFLNLKLEMFLFWVLFVLLFFHTFIITAVWLWLFYSPPLLLLCARLSPLFFTVTVINPFRFTTEVESRSGKTERLTKWLTFWSKLNFNRMHFHVQVKEHLALGKIKWPSNFLQRSTNDKFPMTF